MSRTKSTRPVSGEPSEAAYRLRRLAKPREEIATLCEVSGPAVSQWLSGATRPGKRQRSALHGAYGIPTDLWDVARPRREEQPSEASQQADEPFDLGEKVRRLERAVNRTLGDLDTSESPTEAAKLAQSLAGTLLALAKLKAEDPITLRRLWKSDVWRRVEDAHRRALRPYPEAAAALARELRALDESEESFP